MFVRSALVAITIALLSGVSSAENEYVFILRAKGNPYWTTLGRGIEDAAREQNVVAKVFYSESESNSEEQLSICQVALERKPLVLGLSAANTAVGIQCLKRALERGVPFGDVDLSLPEEALREANVKLSFAVGSDNLEIGKVAAHFVVEKVRPASMNILVLEGAPGSIPGKKRVDGFKGELLKLHPDARVIASISASWDRMKAMSVVLDLLQRAPELSVIFAANDMMALGAVEAAKLSRRKDLSIIGVDGTDEAKNAIAQGVLTASVSQLPYHIGRRSLELALRVSPGKELREYTPTPVLTKDGEWQR